MEQIAVSFTSSWVPTTGLSPIVNIWEKNGTKRVTDWACTEIAGWRYIYNFDKYNNDKIYLYQFDWTDTLSDSDRYKFWGNEMDAYSNKYSRGRTAVPATNYMPNFSKLEKGIKDVPQYNDTELKTLLKEMKNIIVWKGGYDVVDLVSKLRKDVEVLSSAINTTNVTENVKEIANSIEMLNNSLESVENNMKWWLLEMEWMIWDRINSFDKNLSTNMDNKFTSEMLAQPVSRLEAKVEDLIKSTMSDTVPDVLLDKYEISLKRKWWNTDDEILSRLQ